MKLADTQQLPLSEKHRERLAEICQAALGKHRASAFLFGSRARGTAKQGSDIDLAIECSVALFTELATLRSLYEESTLPYKLDIVDMTQAQPALRKSVHKEGILLWKS